MLNDGGRYEARQSIMVTYRKMDKLGFKVNQTLSALYRDQNPRMLVNPWNLPIVVVRDFNTAPFEDGSQRLQANAVLNSWQRIINGIWIYNKTLNIAAQSWLIRWTVNKNVTTRSQILKKSLFLISNVLWVKVGIPHFWATLYKQTRLLAILPRCCFNSTFFLTWIINYWVLCLVKLLKINRLK